MSALVGALTGEEVTVCCDEQEDGTGVENCPCAFARCDDHAFFSEDWEMEKHGDEETAIVFAVFSEGWEMEKHGDEETAIVFAVFSEGWEKEKHGDEETAIVFAVF